MTDYMDGAGAPGDISMSDFQKNPFGKIFGPYRKVASFRQFVFDIGPTIAFPKQFEVSIYIV